MLKILKFILLVILIYVLFVIWPLKAFLTPSFLMGSHLVVLTNEYEARPCGGFITAVGRFQLFPLEMELDNAYRFKEVDLGEASYPLDRVAKRQKFWDLGIDSNLSLCSENLKRNYESITETTVDSVILVNVGVLESVFSLIKTVDFEGTKLDENNFFSWLSRQVANIDRHDESALETRKKPMALLGKQLMREFLFSPIRIPFITQKISQHIDSGAIFVSGFSPEIKKEDLDFAVLEWNLGGGKSSRFLKKDLKIQGQEISPDLWNFKVAFSAHHLGGQDEPISQDWKGVFEIMMPQFLGGKTEKIEKSLKIGESFEKEYEYKGVKMTDLEFGIFTPRGQELFAEVLLTLYPQKYFVLGENISTKDNVAIFQGKIEGFRKKFTWMESPDGAAPFIVFHEIIKASGLETALQSKFENANLVAEIHFNETVILTDDFTVALKDRDYAQPDVSADPLFQTLSFIEGKTLILGFVQDKTQKDERYYLEIEGIEDVWGNELVTAPRTLITR